MTLEPKYQPRSGNEISNQQKNSLNKDLNAYYINGNNLNEELFENDELVITTYKVTNQPEINSILVVENTADFKMSYNTRGYDFLEELSYVGGVLKNKTVYLSVSNDDAMYIRNYTIDNLGLETGATTEKNYYENDERRYLFEYHFNGSCLRIHDMISKQNDIHAANIGDPSITDFTSSGFEYYEFAEPINPNDLIVV